MFSTQRRKTFKVAVEGNIGSGKTTLIKSFENDPNVDVWPEPVQKWRNIQGQNALVCCPYSYKLDHEVFTGTNVYCLFYSLQALMYEDPTRWSLTLQTYVQLTMLETHLETTPKPVKMMERSLYSAKYCFVENLKQR